MNNISITIHTLYYIDLYHTYYNLNYRTLLEIYAWLTYVTYAFLAFRFLVCICVCVCLFVCQFLCLSFLPVFLFKGHDMQLTIFIIAIFEIETFWRLSSISPGEVCTVGNIYKIWKDIKCIQLRSTCNNKILTSFFA